MSVVQKAFAPLHDEEATAPAISESAIKRARRAISERIARERQLNAACNRLQAENANLHIRARIQGEVIRRLLGALRDASRDSARLRSVLDEVEGLLEGVPS